MSMISSPQIHPTPQVQNFSGARCSLAGRRWFILPADAGFPLKNAARAIAAELSPRFPQPIRCCCGIPGKETPLLFFSRESAIPAEGYRLEIPGSDIPARLYASGDAGFYYGLLTFLQLLKRPAAVPCGTVEDRPSLPERGFLLDVSRSKVPTMTTLKQLIRSLSRLRFNELQLYIEHTFAFADDERVWYDSSPLTPDEVLELDECCRNHFIELVPNLNSFGHLNRYLELPEYRDLAECDAPYYHQEWDCCFRATLCPGEPALEFLKRRYEAFLPNFTSRRFNVDCDEPMELGHGRSRERCRSRGVGNVYLEMIHRIASLAAEHGRTIQLWGDILGKFPELYRNLPAGATVLEWHYEASDPFEPALRELREAGVPALACPGTSSWKSLCGRTGNMLGNIGRAGSEARSSGARGMLLTDWGDGGHHQHLPISYPGIAAASESAWGHGAESLEQRIPHAIAFAFPDARENPRLGELLLEFGRTEEDFRHPLRGQNLLFGMLFSPNNRLCREAFAAVTPGEISAAQRRLGSFRRRLTSSTGELSPECLTELANAAELTALGLENLARLKGKPFRRNLWNDRMRHVIGEFRHLWLVRNRPGGADFSIYCLNNLVRT